MTNFITIPNLPAGIAVNGTEQVEAVQNGVSVRLTTQQIGSYIQGTPLIDLNFISPLLRVGNDVTLTTVPPSLGGTGATSATGTAGSVVLSISPAITTPTLSGDVVLNGGSIFRNSSPIIPWINVATDYGCDMTGATDSLTNFNLAVAAWNTQGGVFFIPAGTLKLSAKPTAFTHAGGMIVGAGKNATTINLAYANDDGFRINNQFTSIGQMTFQSTVFRGTSGYDVVFASGVYRNLVHNTAHLYGCKGVNVAGSGVTFLDVTFFNLIGDTGVLFQGTALAPVSGGYFIDCVFGNTYPRDYTTFSSYSNPKAFTAGQLTTVSGYVWQCDVGGTTATAGLTIPSSSQSAWATNNVTSGTAQFRACWDDDLTWVRQDSYANSISLKTMPLLGGVYGYAMTDSAVTGTSFPNWAFFDDVEFDHQSQGGIRADGGKGLAISDSWFGSSLSGHGVWINGLYQGETTIVGNHFLALGGVGVWFEGIVKDTLIEGNLFLANSTASPGILPAVYAGPGVDQFTVNSNIFGSHVGAGVGNQYCGLLVDVGTSLNWMAQDNNAYDTASGFAVIDGSGATATKMIRNNLPIQAGTPITAAEGGTGLTALGTGVATALGINVGSAGAFVAFNGALGTPSSGTATNLTGLPVSTGISGLGTGVATFLATPSSANLAAAVTGETGTGALMFGTSPTITTQLTITGGTVTTSTPIVSATQTWNAGGVTFNGFLFNVTNTASAAASTVFDFQVGGASAFKLDAAGQVTGTFTRDQNNNTLLQVYNPNTSASATAGLRLFSGTTDFLDLYVSDNLNLVQMTGGGSATQMNRAFTTHVWLTGGGTQQGRLTTDGMRVGATASVATSTLTVEGSIAGSSVVTKTADFTLAATESTVINNKSGSGCVMTSTPASFPGRMLWLQNNQAQTLTSAASNVVPKGGGAAGTAILPATATAWAMLVSNGTNWVIIMSGT